MKIKYQKISFLPQQYVPTGNNGDYDYEFKGNWELLRGRGIQVLWFRETLCSTSFRIQKCILLNYFQIEISDGEWLEWLWSFGDGWGSPQMRPNASLLTSMFYLTWT